MNDIRRMRKQVFNYLRFVASGIIALAAGGYLKLTGQPAFAGPPQTRPGEATKAGATEPAVEADAARFTDLHAEVDRLSKELAELRATLDLMYPPPGDVPSELAMVEAQTGASADPLANIRKSELFAPPPDLQGARSLFHQAELGAFKSRDAAEASWRRIAKDARLTALSPRYTTDGAQTRLVVGSLPSAQAVDTLCVELSGVAGACRPFVPVSTY